ncbi:hypothetical protein OKW21_004229 [Catalinimonas alkaloidigena]|uniref:hypothetical protein n=1 Tax=Catalinimonas alkaloidigena TaxID=1075417 RepID=UPI0024052748|nr:hypothetical protein [Catalinimonas alkaloidigena]MDF9798966.1 hypothetical protein [Catalinimonas alkaloidigena]
MNAKSYISLFLAVLLCLHAWQMSLIVLNYEYNQEVFVRLFCENQDRPELQCNGKCFLQDSIDHASQQESTNEHEVKLCWSPLCMQMESRDALKASQYYIQIFFPFPPQEYQLLLSQGFFHPPRA